MGIRLCHPASARKDEVWRTLASTHLLFTSGMVVRGCRMFLVARKPDPWDADLPDDIRAKHASLQALKDAIVVRSILFAALPDIHRAKLRTYRVSPGEPAELIVVGNVEREREAVPTVASVAMRAKLLGFHFSMDDGVLRALEGESHFLALASVE